MHPADFSQNHHSMDTSSDNPCVYVLWPTVHQSKTAMSEVYERPVCTQSSLLAVQKRLPGCEVSHDLVVILSTDLAIFGQFKHQWIHKISVTTQCVFSPPLCGSPPPPTNHPYVITCGTGEKTI